MTIVHLSYAQIKEHDPSAWIKKLRFYTGILEAMCKYAEVKSVHCILSNAVLVQNNVEYHFLNPNQWQLYFPITLHAYLKKLLPDVVIVHGLIFPWQVVLLRWQLGKKTKIIGQHHAEKPFKDIRKYLQRWADSYIGAYLFCSREQGSPWISSKSIRHAGKIKEIMGTSSPFQVIKKEEAIAVTKAQTGSNYLWVGRLDKNKDPLLVARAFIRFNKINPTARLYMIYQTFELLTELQTILRREPGADKFIHLIGPVENEALLYWYNSAEFIISSSHYEGSGIAVCEGMSCGCIPILTDIPSFRMMTDQGRTALLYKSGDEDGLLASLCQSMTIDCEAMKLRVLERFHSTLSFDANAKSILETIKSIENK